MNWHNILPEGDIPLMQWSTSGLCNFRVRHENMWLTARLEKTPDPQEAEAYAKQMIRYHCMGSSTCYCCWSKTTCDKSESM